MWYPNKPSEKEDTLQMQKGKILGYVQIWEILQILGYVQTYIWCPQWYNNVRDIINFGVTKKKKKIQVFIYYVV